MVNPFDLHLPDTAPWHRRAALAAAHRLLSRPLGFVRLAALYERSRHLPEGSFPARALRTLEISIELQHPSLDDVPADGPLIVVANHPHGALDGLALADIVLRRRADVRLLANRLLARVPELRDHCLFVDPFGGPGADRRSRAGLRAALRWLRGGHALIALPSGEVAYAGARHSTPADSRWHPTVARLALASGAAVLPVFIEGRNNRLFYAAGRVHPLMRTALLGRALLERAGTSVAVRIGSVVDCADLGAVDAAAATVRLRDAVEALAPRSGSRRRHERHPQTAASETASAAPACARAHRTAGRVAAEIRVLPADRCLVENGALQVFYTDAASIPETLAEIGQLREVTFRAVGEGTGGEVDLDRFDRHYQHLFAWDRDREVVVGAYRVGVTDRIVASHGVAGLYTSSLFRYDARLLERLSPALELGRSFVRAEYQRNSNALLVLWKGIGQIVARAPEYRVLFGPVSISSRYADTSQQLLRAFLAQNHLHDDLAARVQALRPPADGPLPDGVDPRVVSSVDHLDRLIARWEPDGKGVPVLLRQYLRLDAKLLGFNVDPAFGDALDALMMVDLTRVDPAILKRYLGREHAARFLGRHRSEPAA